MDNDKYDYIDLLYGPKGPTAKQRLFRDSPAKYRLYGGSVGGGKTYALCVEALRHCLYFPGNRVAMFRFENKSFKKTTLQTLLKLIRILEENGTPIMEDHKLTTQEVVLKNGSVILYDGLGDLTSEEKVRSLEIAAFFLDEASEIHEEFFNILKSRLRWKLPDGRCPAYVGLLASNPEPGWVKKRFADRLHDPLPLHAFIPALPKDNPHLPKGYIDDLRLTNPESWVTRFVDGDWSAFSGQIYTSFDRNVHVFNGDRLLPALTAFSRPYRLGYDGSKIVIDKVWRAIDHGSSHPTVCLWFAQDRNDNVYIFHEYYQTGITSMHCNNIIGETKKLGLSDKVSYTLLPHDTRSGRQEKDGMQWSVWQEYCSHDIACTLADNSVAAGIQRMFTRLRVDENRINPFTGESGSPSIFIAESCTHLIEEMLSYRWSRTRTDAPHKEHDDAVDAARYGVMVVPSPVPVLPPGPKPNTWDYIEAQQADVVTGRGRGLSLSNLIQQSYAAASY